MAIVDPFNQNQAVLSTGQLGHAIRIIDPLKDPEHPTMNELMGGQVIGYGNITGGEISGLVEGR